MTIVKPGGGGLVQNFVIAAAHVAKPIEAYMGTPARAFMRMLDKANGLAVGNPTLMVKRIIASVDISPVPLRMV